MGDGDRRRHRRAAADADGLAATIGVMRLPINAPIEPMLAKASDALPDGDGWLSEP
jgi:hypothetical protein